MEVYMPSTNRKLDQFIATILSDANAESTEIQKEINTRRNAFLEKTETDLLNEMYNYVRTKSSEARTDTGRRISKATMENKRTLFNYRASIAKNVFNDVKARIQAYVQTSEYVLSLAKLAAFATAELHCPDIQILLRPDDMKYSEILAAQTPAEYIPGEIDLGGLIAKSPSKNLRIDLTYDASFVDVTDKFGELSGFGV